MRSATGETAGEDSIDLEKNCCLVVLFLHSYRRIAEDDEEKEDSHSL